MAQKRIVKSASQRQLRVGEQVRQSLYEFFLNEDFIGTPLEKLSVTVTEVRVSPDLKNSTAYVSALGGNEPEGFAKLLNDSSAQIRHIVASNSSLKYTPKILFKLDDSFERVSKINSLFAKDLGQSTLPDED